MIPTRQYVLPRHSHRHPFVFSNVFSLVLACGRRREDGRQKRGRDGEEAAAAADGNAEAGAGAQPMEEEGAGGSIVSLCWRHSCALSL
jgi:hypothetical protein